MMRSWPRRRATARDAFVKRLGQTVLQRDDIAHLIVLAQMWADLAAEDALDTYLDALVRKRRVRPKRKAKR